MKCLYEGPPCLVVPSLAHRSNSCSRPFLDRILIFFRRAWICYDWLVDVLGAKVISGLMMAGFRFSLFVTGIDCLQKNAF